jgi:integrase
MLIEWRLQSGSPEWVFKRRVNKPFAPEGWRADEWERIKKQFNLPQDLRFHDLRHTFASILLSEGADVGDVQKLLRHSSYRTTTEVYRHLLPGQLEKNFEIFNSGILENTLEG